MTDPRNDGLPERARGLRRVAWVGVCVAAALALATLTSPLWSTLLEEDAPRVTDVLARIIDTQGVDAAVDRYRQLRAQDFAGHLERESDTNTLGYALLRKGVVDAAIRIFELNVETHPRSANVHDSLAEAHAIDGNRARAIESYRTALALDPRRKSARHALRKLTGEPAPPYRPGVLFHIAAGTVSLLAGAAALSFRKGSRAHARAGTIFAIAMLGMSASATLMAALAPYGDTINVLMGLFTLYLVATSWWTARRRNEEPRVWDWLALAAALALSAGLARGGLEAATSITGTKEGHGPALWFFWSSVALLAASLDLRTIATMPLTRPARLTRHLWRMCAALFIAVTSLFLGQPQVFPENVRGTPLLFLPSLAVALALLYWLVRTNFTQARRPIAV